MFIFSLLKISAWTADYSICCKILLQIIFLSVVTHAYRIFVFVILYYWCSTYLVKLSSFVMLLNINGIKTSDKYFCLTIFAEPINNHFPYFFLITSNSMTGNKWELWPLPQFWIYIYIIHFHNVRIYNLIPLK